MAMYGSGSTTPLESSSFRVARLLQNHPQIMGHHGKQQQSDDGQRDQVLEDAARRRLVDPRGFSFALSALVPPAVSSTIRLHRHNG